MRIRCPFCGDRDLTEFVYHGDAHYQRPDARETTAASQYLEAVYLRANPAGVHEELWYHAFGCRSWLRARRDTRTHEFHAVEFVQAPEGSAK
jgi:heterotetrameric sarcosine oxidase delta subunit